MVVHDEKARAIRRMFARIAHRYDLLNTILSANQHHLWRRKAVEWARLRTGDWALDVATGTADFALALARRVGPQGRVVGVDFCEPILARGRAKVARSRYRRTVHLGLAAAEALPFADDTFAAATIGFALRNVTSVEQTLREMSRVVRPNGRVVTLELTPPDPGWFRRLYEWYARVVIPRLGGWLSGQPEAYAYLPQSIATFMSPEALAELMRTCGLVEVSIHRLSGGVATVHVGVKPVRGGR
jgi:demethylmenaquinone methyltransferase/2-methoxy-6-polyprenyl-1,4-benzoquinol methylase